MNKRLNLRIALIFLLLTLMVIVPVYAQDTSQESTASPEPTATVEITAEATEVATAEVTMAAVVPTVEVTSAAVETSSTVEAIVTSEATIEPTEETTIEAGGVLPTDVPPESRPVAGVPEEPAETLSSSGVVILVLLVGLAAIGATAFSALMRGRSFTPPQ